MQLVIVDSARKHGVADEDIVHALCNAIREYPEQGDYALTVAIGVARNGVTLLEIGFDIDDDERVVVVHAQLARKKYL